MKVSEKVEQLKQFILKESKYSVYDYDEVTMTELLNKFFNKIQNCIEVTNNTIELTEWLVSEGLEQEVAEKMVLYSENGTFEKLINVDILNNLRDRVEDVNNKLSNVVVNLFDYKDLVVEKNGCENWQNAFNKAFNDVKDGGIIVIPKHQYYIEAKATLENKKNITINCAGVIKPLNDVKPIIGLLTFRNLKDCVVNGLNFDGNKDNIVETNTYGLHSLLCFDDCSNMVFNNLVIKNTYESGLNSNGNLNNIVFNNIELEEIGEHGLYFGGTNIKNIYINNLTCNNIGKSKPNKNRHVGVIKFRNKLATDILHDNIVVDGFSFTHYDNDINYTDGNTRCFIIAYDCKNITIKNGDIKGENTCILQSNTTIDNFYVEKVLFDGKFLMYSIVNKTGWNEPQTILNNGECNIVYIDCSLKGYTRYLSLLKMFNCHLELTSICNDAMIKEDYNIDNFKYCYFDKCIIKNNSFRFNYTKAENILIKSCEFIDLNLGVQPLFDLALKENSIFKVSDSVTDDLSTFISTSSSIDCSLVNSILKGNIKSTSAFKVLNIVNCKLKENRIYLTATYDVLNVNGVYSLDGERKDTGVFKATCKSHNTSVNLPLKYKIMEKVKPEKLLITNNRGISFEFSVNDDNVVNLSTIERQEVDTEFTVLYSM